MQDVDRPNESNNREIDGLVVGMRAQTRNCRRENAEEWSYESEVILGHACMHVHDRETREQSFFHKCAKGNNYKPGKNWVSYQN